MTWQTLQADSQELAGTKVLATFRSIQQRYFTDAFMFNPRLGVELRGWQQRDGWYEGLLLTPWMLARVYFPSLAPVEALPEGWDAATRQTADYVVIGPTIDFDIGEERPTAHLNYDPELGHYLLQPLVQSLGKYADAQAVFTAWGGVLTARQESRQRMLDEQQQQQQAPVSRRDFMTKWLKSS